ncbi:MAG TPA: class III signal peptide-containing protein [Methanobacteriales archaeon]|nr:class III signal peptide-containing protein [Methanobacteriales archaeon]HIH61084.1 class III signal peptide-containing protein [Methanobacteriales archaeon]
MLLEEEAQVSAEMILIIGALLVIVIVVGVYVRSIAETIAGNITDVINAARDSTIQKL